MANSIAKLPRCEISSLRTGALRIMRSQRGVGAGLDAAFGLLRRRWAGRLPQSIRDPETERFWWWSEISTVSFAGLKRHRGMETSVSAEDGPRTWHICWQAAKGRNLLVDPSMVDRIRDRLFAAHEPRERALLLYLLMPTEIHVLCRLPASAGPGTIARAVANLVSRWVRDIDRTRGPVFAGRYHAHEVPAADMLRREVRMLAWRPVAVGLCARPTYYTRSSLRMSLGLERTKDFDAKALASTFGETVHEARMAMRSVIRGRPPAVELREWELSHGLALAIGSANAASPLVREVDGVAAAFVAAGGSEGIDGAIKLLERWVALKLGLRDGQCLAKLGGSQGARARALVAGLAVQSELCSAAFVARHFKRAKATLCEQMAASRRRLEDQRLLAVPKRDVLSEAVKLRAQNRSDGRR
ncbi:transposase [Roseateles sp. LYH14W]|uniref:Transposase n=1 Tax=Pelomonas parva TaxID=3299032 RepID=A0ABW7F668_9BURK